MKSLFKTALWFAMLIPSGQFVYAQKDTILEDGTPAYIKRTIAPNFHCACSQKDLSPAGVMMGMRHLKGMWMFSYSYMHMQTQDNQTGSTPLTTDFIFHNNPTYIMAPDHMSMDMHMLMGMYGITDRLSVMVMTCYNVFKMSMAGVPGKTMVMHDDGTMSFTDSPTSQEMTSITSGLGDTKLLATYALYVHKGTSLTASGGISVPTGSIQQMGTLSDMSYGRRLSYMMQLGSGTVDLLPGLTYVHNNTNNSFGFGAQATSIIRPYTNSVGYQLGNEFTANTWVAYQLFGCISPTLRAEGTTAGRIKGYDPELFQPAIQPDDDAANYGGTKINGYAGLSLYIKNVPVLRNSRLLVEYGMPLYQHVNGIQLATKRNINATLRFSF